MYSALFQTSEENVANDFIIRDFIAECEGVSYSYVFVCIHTCIILHCISNLCVHVHLCMCLHHRYV